MNLLFLIMFKTLLYINVMLRMFNKKNLEVLIIIVLWEFSEHTHKNDDGFIFIPPSQIVLYILKQRIFPKPFQIHQIHYTL